MTVAIWKCLRPLFGKCYCINHNVEGEGKKGRERRRERETEGGGQRGRQSQGGTKGERWGVCVDGKGQELPKKLYRCY